MRPGLTILIEGLDLAGKSTLRRGLEQAIGTLGYDLRLGRNSLCPGNHLAEEADTMRRDPNRDIFKTSEVFLQAHCWDAEHFQQPPLGTIHLQDSCWMRTLAFARFSRDEVSAFRLEKAAANFPQFDVVFFLTASLDVRRQRLQNREHEEPGANDAGDAWVNSRPHDFLRLEAELLGVVRSFSTPVVIDTTEIESGAIREQVVGGIERALRQRLHPTNS